MAGGIEADFLGTLRRLATAPAARGLADDAAVLPWPLGLDLVATHDMLVEGVHFRPDCPPADVGWKLVAVNYSDLAAMSAQPVACLMGAAFGAKRDSAWADAFAAGVGQALAAHGGALVGGDTVRSDQTVLALTALGSAPPGASPGRGGGKAGDDLWLSGTVGDAGLGLALLTGTRRTADGKARAALVRRYRRPTPRLGLGLALRGLASAMMDVSDGLLIDAARMAEASGLVAELTLGGLPLGPAARSLLGDAPALTDLRDLATAGDDYELLFAATPARRADIIAAGQAARTPVTRIGCLAAGAGPVRLADAPLPERLGWLHR